MPKAIQPDHHSPSVGLNTRRTLDILLASAAAAVSTLLITIVAARGLVHDGDASGYAEFMVFWSFLFGTYGIVVGLANESTRAVGNASQRPRPVETTSRASVLVVASMLSAAVGAVAAGTSPLWGPKLTPGTMPIATWIVAIGIVLYGLYQAWLGVASGLHDWSFFSLLMVLDAAVRLVLVLLAAVIGAGLLGFEIACVAASFAWVVVTIPSARGRRVLSARADVPLGRFVHNNLLSMVSSTSTAILITAFPTLIKLTSRGEAPGVLAGTITAISLTRSPLLIPLQAFQGVAIASFLTRANHVARSLLRPVGILTLIGLVFAAIAAAAGPWVLRILYGPAIIASAQTFAGLTVAAIPLAILTLTGTVTVALNAHIWFSTGWLCAAVVSSLLLFLPLDLPTRVTIGLFAGPALGASVHMVAIHYASVSQ